MSEKGISREFCYLAVLIQVGTDSFYVLLQLLGQERFLESSSYNYSPSTSKISQVSAVCHCLTNNTMTV